MVKATRTIRALGLAGLAGGLALTTAMSAHARPVQVRSENIVFVGDVDPGLAAERVREWEVYRRMIYVLSGIKNPPKDPETLHIYGFAKESDLQKFAADSGIAGVYARSNNGPIFLTSLNENRDGASHQTGLHEYSHHVLHGLVKQGFPRWYDEGFANYLATMEINDDTVVMGDPSNRDLQYLAQGDTKFISPETVLSANTLYPQLTRRERGRGGIWSFYGQASLYVHYLVSHPEWNAKLSDYLAALENGVEPIPAFEQTYGESVEDFHDRAMNYFRSEAFVLNTYTPGEDIMDVDTTVRALSDADLARAQIPARLRFLSKGNRNAFKKQLKTASTKYPTDPEVMLGYGNLDILDKNFDRARARGEAMLAAMPDSHPAKHIVAEAAYHADLDTLENSKGFTPFPVTEGTTLAMRHWTEILAENPIDYNAINHVVSYYGANDAPVDDIAFTAARAMDVRFMDGFDPGTGLSLAVIYAKRDYMLDACNYAQTARFEMKDRKAKAFIAKLDWFDETYGQSCEPAG